MRALWLAIVVAVTLLSVPCSAQPIEPAVGPVAPISAADQIRALADGSVSIEQVSDELQDAFQAVQDARAADRAGRLAAMMAALAAAFKLLLSLVKVAGGLSIWKKRQAAIIRLVTLVLGIGVFGISSIVAGMPWWEALFLSLSGPGAMVVHEYSRLLGKAKV
jgi:hypothetical protein